jgi:tetratricopeptide (TPR) repeat protein
MAPRTLLVLPLAVALAGCQRPAVASPPPVEAAAPIAAAAAPIAAAAAPTVVADGAVDSGLAGRQATPKETAPHPHGHVAEPLALCPEGPGTALVRARAHFDKGEFGLALSCSARACADQPDSAEAHAERGQDLAALDRLDEASLAFQHALALSPDQPDALLGACDLFLTRMTPTREHDQIALIYAERGLAWARKEKASDQLAAFALEAAMAHNDLGEPAQAVERADEALKGKPDRSTEEDATYEKASALYELCRFDEAQVLFKKLLTSPAKEAFAHYQLGLLLERKGEQAEADKEIARAQKLEPERFPPEVPTTQADFKAMLDRQLAALPADMRKDIAGVPITAVDLPPLDDLVLTDPPLSPTILGIFRGPPLDEACGAEKPCRSISLFRKNLARVTHDRAELEEQVKVTLLHEIGHLRGEDDAELASRGLE